MLPQCFPQLGQVGWMSFGWWIILDTDGKLLSVENPAALQLLTHSNRCAWHLLLFPIQRHLPIHPQWHTYTNHVSIVKNPSLTGLFPFIYTDWSGFKLTSISTHSFHLDSPSQSVMERACFAHLVYCACLISTTLQSECTESLLYKSPCIPNNNSLSDQIEQFWASPSLLKLIPSNTNSFSLIIQSGAGLTLQASCFSNLGATKDQGPMFWGSSWLQTNSVWDTNTWRRLH